MENAPPDKWAAMVPNPHPAANCGPLTLPLPPGSICPTCGTLIDHSLPPAITAWLDGFERDSAGIRGTATPLTGDKWLITTATDRMRLTIRYHLLSRNRLQMTSSVLEKDGQQIPRADSYVELLGMFADPDDSRPADLMAPPALDAMTEADPASLPPEIAKMVTLMRTKTRHLSGGFTIQVLTAAGGWWSVLLRNARVEFRFNARTWGMNPNRPTHPVETRPWKAHMFALVIDGEDVTHLIPAGNIGAAFARVTTALASPPAGPRPDSRPRVTPTGVTVRNQVVMRN